MWSPTGMKGGSWPLAGGREGRASIFSKGVTVLTLSSGRGLLVSRWFLCCTLVMWGATLTAVRAGVDCNSNGQSDLCDISCANAGCTGVPLCGTSADCNTNNVPDECESFPSTPMTSIRVADNLSSPLGIAAPKGDSRLFIVEQGGYIRILSGGSVLVTPYLDIDALTNGGGERGLLGLAFDPNFQANARFYVNYTNTSGNTVIAQYTATGGNPISNTADPTSAVILKTITQDFANHNGGCLQFGPDGMLYVGMGDGGSGNDPNNRAQSSGSLLGKMLRLDVNNGPTYVPADNPYVGAGNPLDEIWAFGLRNPWRFSFDRLKGDMYIGDVGQDANEEIDFEPAGLSVGRNFGWRCMEGTACTGLSGCTCNGPTLTLPILNVPQSTGACAITGGYVYRGCAMPDRQGLYFYSDVCGNFISTFRYSQVGGLTEHVDRTVELAPDFGSISSIVSFGEDGFGELYYCSIGNGDVYKIVPSTAVCGNNNIEAGEQCDDGDTMSGDGCSSTCQIESSDSCATAMTVGSGSTPFNTVGTATDGPVPTCEGGALAANDIWFDYNAPCTGTATFSTCNTANFDSVLVIYGDCGCPAVNGEQLGCDDDTSGCGTTSQIAVSVSQGGCYKVRLGGFAASDEGSGLLTITCVGPVCGNNQVEAGEECDDGNTMSGDGCDSQCSNEAPPPCPCVDEGDCHNSVCAYDNGCNCVACVTGECVFSCSTFGNVDCAGAVAIDDILCLLNGFADSVDCVNSDIVPCGGNGVTDLDDILGVLNAFSGQNPCGCDSGGTVPDCGFVDP